MGAVLGLCEGGLEVVEAAEAAGTAAEDAVDTLEDIGEQPVLTRNNAQIFDEEE